MARRGEGVRRSPSSWAARATPCGDTCVKPRLGATEPRAPRPCKLDAYKDYLRERIEQARPRWIPATVLLREIGERGYGGGISQLKAWLAPLKRASPSRWCASRRRRASRCRPTSRVVRRGRDPLLALVATLGYSRATFVKFTTREDAAHAVRVPARGVRLLRRRARARAVRQRQVGGDRARRLRRRPAPLERLPDRGRGDEDGPREDERPRPGTEDHRAGRLRGERPHRRSCAIQRGVTLCEKLPEVMVSGPTYGWLHAACRAMRKAADPKYAAVIHIPSLFLVGSLEEVRPLRQRGAIHRQARRRTRSHRRSPSWLRTAAEPGRSSQGRRQRRVLSRRAA